MLYKKSEKMTSNSKKKKKEKKDKNIEHRKTKKNQFLIIEQIENTYFFSLGFTPCKAEHERKKRKKLLTQTSL